MPIFNGAVYLEAALESLLAQDYPNFEIHVSDNASTDDTWDILRSYQSKCDRLRLNRWSKNVGAVCNFQHVLLNSDARYFMWAAHDDIWGSNFISEAVSVLQSDSSAVIVNAKTVLIDSKNQELPLPVTRPQLCDLKGSTYPDRIEALSQRVGWCLYGLFPRDTLLKTSILTQNEITLDVIMTYELAGLGTFRVLDNTEFRYRILPKTQSTVADSLGVDKSKATNTLTRMFVNCSQSILYAPVSTHEIEDAIRRFLNVCAAHDEWWPGLSSEMGWDQTSVMPVRLSLMEQLIEHPILEI